MDRADTRSAEIQVQADEKDHSQIVKGEPWDMFQPVFIPLLETRRKAMRVFANSGSRISWHMEDGNGGLRSRKERTEAHMVSIGMPFWYWSYRGSR